MPLALAAAALAGATRAAASLDPGVWPPPATAPIVFPVVGAAKYFDDFGQPRPQGPHEGNDILTTWRSPAVAAEDGTVKLWTTSARAGCMLYLYGDSGTMYLYIHLNNDLTAAHDNKGTCVPGIAYVDGLKNGARVTAGQQIGYNGDSGDAEGTYHLHFEVHPDDGDAVDPFPYLNDATRLLFPMPAGGTAPKVVVIGLKGMPVSAGAGMLELSVTAVRVWPGGAWMTVPARSVELTVPEDAVLDPTVSTQILSPTRRALSSRAAVPLVVITRPAQPTLDVSTAAPGALAVERIRVG